MTNAEIFKALSELNVNEKTEKKNGLTYLSWAWAWAEFKKICPDATYEVVKFNGLPYVHDPATGYMVYTTVTAGDVTHEMWLPVMDHRNRTLMDASMFDINKAIMRCLTKNLAMFGLGLYIYAGEDLPEGEKQDEPEPTCQQCGKPFEAFTDDKGRTWSPKQMYVAMARKSEDGVVRCPRCYKAMKEGGATA